MIITRHESQRFAALTSCHLKLTFLWTQYSESLTVKEVWSQSHDLSLRKIIMIHMLGFIAQMALSHHMPWIRSCYPKGLSS